jgi:hypothetical protein
MPKLLLSGVLLAAAIAVAWDIRSPQITEEACRVVATSQVAASDKPASAALYAHGSNPLYDVVFDCQTQGRVWVNDQEIFERYVAAGHPATLRTRRYRFLPTYHQFQVETGFDASKIQRKGQTR